MQGRNAHVSRVFRILTILAGASQGLSALEIWRRLSDRDVSISKRTIYRDLEAIERAGFPLSQDAADGDKGAARWRLDRGSKIVDGLALSCDELAALSLARGAIQGGALGPLGADLANVLAKLEDRLSGTHRRHLDEAADGIKFDLNPEAAPEIERGVFEAVRAACLERQVLAVSYESARSGVRAARRIGPHYIYLAKGAAYLVGEDLAARATKVFALSRMTAAVMEDEPYAGAPVDHERFFQGSFGVYRGGPPSAVRIAFASQMARFASERRWHASQKTTLRDDGRVELALCVSITPDLVRWILGFGADAEVIEPEDLRAQVADAAARMAGIYERRVGATASTP